MEISGIEPEVAECGDPRKRQVRQHRSVEGTAPDTPDADSEFPCVKLRDSRLACYTCVMDSTLNEPELAQLASMSRAIVDLRSALNRLEDSRAALIRRLDSSGTNRALMADVAGLSRGRIWQIMNPAYREGADGFDADVDTDLLNLADSLWEYAVDQWEKSGGDGSPDDYFPIDAVLR